MSLIEKLKELIFEKVEECDDADLLDLIHKLLIAEG